MEAIALYKKSIKLFISLFLRSNFVPAAPVRSPVIDDGLDGRGLDGPVPPTLDVQLDRHLVQAQALHVRPVVHLQRERVVHRGDRDELLLHGLDELPDVPLLRRLDEVPEVAGDVLRDADVPHPLLEDEYEVLRLAHGETGGDAHQLVYRRQDLEVLLDVLLQRRHRGNEAVEVIPHDPDVARHPVEGRPHVAEVRLLVAPVHLGPLEEALGVEDRRGRHQGHDALDHHEVVHVLLEVLVKVLERPDERQREVVVHELRLPLLLEQAHADLLLDGVEDVYVHAPRRVHGVAAVHGHELVRRGVDRRHHVLGELALVHKLGDHVLALLGHACEVVRRRAAGLEVLEEVVPGVDLLRAHVGQDYADGEDERVGLLREALPDGPELHAREGVDVLAQRRR
mmetsp:Transcript_33701/g.80611  ORF Transcript_33701/g.80611 Transcript_33701/m.80611 type:complete len:397 (+) Transcript_33701:1-1191(+)